MPRVRELTTNRRIIQEKVMQLLNDAPAEKKAEAIMQSIEMIQEAAHEDLVNQVVAEAERASHDADFKKQLGLRNLSQEEKKFYEGFKDIKQSITANQIDIIPTEIIDRTLDDVKKASPILNLVNMAPANVKKWIVASHTGAAVWGALTDSVPQYKQINSKCICVIDGAQHEIYNVAHVTTKDGFKETELTLKTPAYDREVYDDETGTQ